jgi:NADPH:quinone reductase-like Zn-dependent oxidoreductase
MYGLRRRDGRTVGPADRVIVVGASGNVGPFAVQIAKWLGAEVTGVCSTGKVDFVRSLGAHHVIDYRSTDFAATGDRYDWILDVDAHQPLLHARRALAPGGRYVMVGGNARDLLQGVVLGPLTGLRGNRRAGLMFWWKPFAGADAKTLTDLVLAGHVRPAIDRRYTLTEVGEALRSVDDGHAKGKVLILNA